MILAFALLLVWVAFSIRPVWLVCLFCAVAAMHWTASLHLADPPASLYAFVAGAIISRIAWALAADLIRPRPL